MVTWTLIKHSSDYICMIQHNYYCKPFLYFTVSPTTQIKPTGPSCLTDDQCKSRVHYHDNLWALFVPRLPLTGLQTNWPLDGTFTHYKYHVSFFSVYCSKRITNELKYIFIIINIFQLIVNFSLNFWHLPVNMNLV